MEMQCISPSGRGQKFHGKTNEGAPVLSDIALDVKTLKAKCERAEISCSSERGLHNLC